MIDAEAFRNDTILLRLRRIYRLSDRPPNPGYAYRHLEHIHAICQTIFKELEGLSGNDELPTPELLANIHPPA